MFIVINNEKITYKRNLKELNKKLKTDFKQDEFKRYNSDYILNVSDDDLDYKRDVHELDKVFVSKLYRKDASNLINYGFYVIILIMLLITLTSVSGMSGMMAQIAEYLKAGA
ncbi:hypothetical protein [Sedimentibacter sp.]|uniref:hypothetical protein n=1 Tax=Sedimentibacter sp. TaxID=1960295 RepID=UPI0028A27870|nr:hypothetical protein [Sedimentibacter sp.]